MYGMILLSIYCAMRCVCVLYDVKYDVILTIVCMCVCGYNLVTDIRSRSIKQSNTNSIMAQNWRELASEN